MANNGKWADENGKLHQSHLAVYFKCPAKIRFNLENTMKIKTDTRRMDLGTLVHETIAEYYEIITDEPKIKDIKDVVSILAHKKWTQNVIPYMKNRFDKCMKTFMELEIKEMKKRKPFKPTLVEKKLDGKRFAGTLDWYHKEQKTLRDFKTGKGLPNQIDMAIQGLIYKELLEENNYPITRVEFVFLNHDKILPLLSVPDSWLDTQLSYMNRDITSNNFTKKIGFLCKDCEYVLKCHSEEENASLWVEW